MKLYNITRYIPIVCIIPIIYKESRELFLLIKKLSQGGYTYYDCIEDLSRDGNDLLINSAMIAISLVLINYFFVQ